MHRETIKHVSVLGLGTMGHGIAQMMAVAGLQVRGYDASEETRRQLHDRVTANLRQLAAAGVVAESEIPETLQRITVCATEAEALTDTQFVTEAVVEDLAVKQRLFERIESSVATETILASNTSSYPMTDIAQKMRYPERAIVTHWFNPPHIIPVVEIVPGAKTSEATTQTAFDFLQQIGKTAIRLHQEIPGFLVNRVQVAVFREVLDLLERGVASAADIDRAIRGSMGLRLAALGPLAIMDFAGLDVTSRVYENLIPHLRGDQQLPRCMDELVKANHFGAKSGQGVFEYPPESTEQQIADRDRRYLEVVKMLH